MAIDPISTASSLAAAARSLPTTAPSASPASPADGADGTNFANLFTGALENLDNLHKSTDALAIQAATGDLADVHEYTIAATEAEIATQLTVAVRDKAVEVFNDIMRMQF